MATAATLQGEHTIELPGHGRTVVRDVPGPHGAPVLLLLHGLGATAALNWGRSIRHLSQQFRVLALDHRGHGRGLRTRRFSLEQCADDAVQAAAELGVRRFVAVGYSMGGPIAALAWRRHPRQVEGLVLCATSRHFTSRSVARVARATLPVAAAAARLLPGAVQRGMLQRLLLRVEHPTLRDRIRDELLGHEPATVIQAAEAVTRFSSHDWIGKVNVPTAVVVTTEDELVPALRQRKLARSIPGAGIFEVAGDHDACVRSADFGPTLLRACLWVTQRAAAAESKRRA
jgi:pimeloyl-ACP methyl ester carboxylesterase